MYSGAVRETVVVARACDRAQVADMLPSKMRLVSVPDTIDSECDALRFVFGSGVDSVISGDFVILRYSAIYLLPSLAEVIASHKSRRLVDKENLVTKVFLKNSSGRSSVALKGNELVSYSPSKECRFGMAIEDVIGVSDGCLEICSFEALKVLNEQPDFKSINADLIGRTLDAKFNDQISSQSVSAYVVESGVLSLLEKPELFLSGIDQIVNSIPRLLPVLPSQKLPNSAWLAGGVTAQGEIEKSFIGKGVSLGENVKIQNSILGGGVEIGMGGFVKNSVIFGDFKIPENGKVENSIILGTGCVLPNSISGYFEGWSVDLNESRERTLSESSFSSESFFFDEICGFVTDGCDTILAGKELGHIATQIRIFRTTQTESLSALVSGLSRALSLEIASRIFSLPSRKEQQELAFNLYEAWSDVLPDLYLDGQSIHSNDVELMVEECKHKELFWLILWGMWRGDFLFDTEAVLEWADVIEEESPKSGSLWCAGLKGFLDHLREQESSESD